MDRLPLEVQRSIRTLGQRVRQARLRRQLGQQEFADACGISRRTLFNVEEGAPGIAVGTLFKILWKLGLLGGADSLAHPDSDEHGKVLEAARLGTHVRRSRPTPDNDF